MEIFKIVLTLSTFAVMTTVSQEISYTKNNTKEHLNSQPADEVTSETSYDANVKLKMKLSCRKGVPRIKTSRVNITTEAVTQASQYPIISTRPPKTPKDVQQTMTSRVTLTPEAVTQASKYPIISTRPPKTPKDVQQTMTSRVILPPVAVTQASKYPIISTRNDSYNNVSNLPLPKIPSASQTEVDSLGSVNARNMMAARAEVVTHFPGMVPVRDHAEVNGRQLRHGVEARAMEPQRRFSGGSKGLPSKRPEPSVKMSLDQLAKTVIAALKQSGNGWKSAKEELKRLLDFFAEDKEERETVSNEREIHYGSKNGAVEKTQIPSIKCFYFGSKCVFQYVVNTGKNPYSQFDYILGIFSSPLSRNFNTRNVQPVDMDDTVNGEGSIHTMH